MFAYFMFHSFKYSLRNQNMLENFLNKFYPNCSVATKFSEINELPCINLTHTIPFKGRDERAISYINLICVQ